MFPLLVVTFRERSGCLMLHRARGLDSTLASSPWRLAPSLSIPRRQRRQIGRLLDRELSNHRVFTLGPPGHPGCVTTRRFRPLLFANGRAPPRLFKNSCHLQVELDRFSRTQHNCPSDIPLSNT